MRPRDLQRGPDGRRHRHSQGIDRDPRGSYPRHRSRWQPGHPGRRRRRRGHRIPRHQRRRTDRHGRCHRYPRARTVPTHHGGRAVVRRHHDLGAGVRPVVGRRRQLPLGAAVPRTTRSTPGRSTLASSDEGRRLRQRHSSRRSSRAASAGSRFTKTPGPTRAPSTPHSTSRRSTTSRSPSIPTGSTRASRSPTRCRVIDGRTIHAFHVEGCGGGHVPDVLSSGRRRQRHRVIDQPDTPLRPRRRRPSTST